MRDVARDFEVRGWRDRLRVLLTGRVASVYAQRPPVLVRQTSYGWSLETVVSEGPSEERYAPRPLLHVEWGRDS